jgi:peptidoglycan/LPS O-acetylase OafA/YrhL
MSSRFVASPQVVNNLTKESQSPSRPSRYRPEIDGLRAFAVIAVIINHFNKDILPSGYLGVDIFFVISGFVIASSLLGRESKNFGDFLSGFYERRIKRLVPTLVVFVLVTSLLICLFNPEPETSLKTGITSLFGLSNLYLLKQATDYFAPSTELNPFTHTWSLGVEEQFYLLFPFLIWFSGFGRQTKNGARNLFISLSILSIASLIAFLSLYSRNQPAAYFLMPTRFWEMAAGSILFIGFEKRANAKMALEQIPPLLIISAMVAVMFLPTDSAAMSTIAIVILSGILIACLKSGTTAYKLLANKNVVHLGLISYSLYLWHWGVLSLARWTVGINLLSAPILALIIYFASDFSYKAIESKVRYKAKPIGRLWTYIFGGVSLLISALAVSLFLRIEPFLYLGSSKLIPARKQTAVQHESCAEKSFRLVFIGDSHAHHFGLAKEYACAKYGVSIETLAEGGTPFPTIVYSNSFHGVSKEDRIESAAKLKQKWDRTAIPIYREGAVVLSNRSLAYFDHSNSDDHINSRPIHYSSVNPSSAISQEQLFQEWLNSINKLLVDNPNVKFIYALPNPGFRTLSVTASLCNVEWFRPSPSDICYNTSSREQQSKKHHHFKAEIIKLADKHHNLSVIDYFDLFCPAHKKSCSIMTTDKVPMYKDEGHFTEQGAIRVVDKLILHAKNDIK